MVPVLEAAQQVHDSLRDGCPGLDEVIPLTHQDMAEDVEMAEMGLFPVIIGGHDHEVINEIHGPRGTPVVKAGSDSTSAAVVDLEWPEDPGARPAVAVALKEVSEYPPDEEFAKLVHRILRPVRELESATLYILRNGENLSSVGVSVAPSTMATCLANAVRDVLQADAAVLNSGAVRGSKAYSYSVSFGDLRNECPYPTPMIIVPMPFSVLQEAVKQSRAAWPTKTPSSLQVDSGVHVDDDGCPTTVVGTEPKPDRLYAVACDVRVLWRNAVFSEYCRQHPDRIPPADAGRPLLPILVEYFCGKMWADLIELATSAKLRRTKTAECGQP
jgi:2',3'-cyclic-nucleotide 2'-phosphodiesterase (5'-nucleotidase family)